MIGTWDLSVAPNMHLIKSLVEHGANIEARGYENNTPMMIALWSGWFHLLVKLLVNGGARVNDGGMIGTPLMHAAVLHQAETVEICKILITNGAEIHHVDHSDYPLLRRAVECGNIHTMRLFVEQESDVHMTDQANRNLLHHAVTLGEPEGTRICEFLVEKGVDLHHRDCRQETPFLTAARFGNIAIIKLLIWSGANINDVDDQGWNALHFTAEAMVEENRYRYRPASKTQHYKDFIRVVQFLLESSCLPSVRILSGQFEKVEIPREVQRAFLGIEE
ncbi:ankyrin repeat-containing domain protein [Podospora fimiseda]|uniref:Ankyrin repeat-containing domain protein n=1 Tax=Podospora fimiseda TaxID=252190 RepID=A0AAN7BI20_9PEZI|nr:ankyrin repeat-containing domain protein [Podospora fimiseda]